MKNILKLFGHSKGEYFCDLRLYFKEWNTARIQGNDQGFVLTL